MNDEFKSMKVPTWVYDNAVAAQNELVRHGVSALPAEVLKPKHCPRCHHEVDFVEATAELRFARIECPACHYKQQTFSVNGKIVAGVGLGMLLGFGLYYLFDKMSEPAPPAQPRALPRAKPKSKARKPARRGR